MAGFAEFVSFRLMGGHTLDNFLFHYWAGGVAASHSIPGGTSTKESNTGNLAGIYPTVFSASSKRNRIAVCCSQWNWVGVTDRWTLFWDGTCHSFDNSEASY